MRRGIQVSPSNKETSATFCLGMTFHSFLHGTKPVPYGKGLASDTDSMLMTIVSKRLFPSITAYTGGVLFTLEGPAVPETQNK